MVLKELKRYGISANNFGLGCRCSVCGSLMSEDSLVFSGVIVDEKGNREENILCERCGSKPNDPAVKLRFPYASINSVVTLKRRQTEMWKKGKDERQKAKQTAEAEQGNGAG